MKYWVYMNGEVPGSYAPQELAALNGFNDLTLVCPAEGEILEKNWRRGGEFPEIIKALQERGASVPPSPPQEFSGDVNQLLDSASSRLYGHVSQLMRELESGREERSLLASVQKQLVEVKEQALRSQARVAELEGKVPRIAELEEEVRREIAQIQSLESTVKTRDESLSETRMTLEKAKTELDTVRRRLGEALNDLAIRNRLVDKLSHDLTDKELSLSKSLGVIRRLEEDLQRLVPAPAADAGEVGEPLPTIEEAPTPTAEPPGPPAYTKDEPVIPPPEAQGALVKRFKKFIRGVEH